MSSREDRQSETNWFGIIAAGAVAVGGAYAMIKLYDETSELCEKLENNTSQCCNAFTHARYLSPRVADLIEIRRDLYCHWVVYVGNGYVIHLVDSGDGKARVLRQKLIEVAANDLCRVNNLENVAKRRHLRAKSPTEVVERAVHMLGNVLDYDLLTNNCEHFATCCRYGHGFSEQSMATTNTPIIRTMASLFASSSPQSVFSIARAANYSS